MKTGRTLHTEDAVRRMRDHVERFSAAKKIANEIVDRAQVWANLDDSYVRDLPPPAAIYRGFLPSFGRVSGSRRGGFPGAGGTVAGRYLQPSLENKVFRGRRGVSFERFYGVSRNRRPVLAFRRLRGRRAGVGSWRRTAPVLVRGALLLPSLAPVDSGASGSRAGRI